MILLLTVLLTGCDRSGPAKSTTPKTVNDHFTIAVDGHPVRMQLAVLQSEMERGLMERRDLGPDDGMLFVYLRPQRLSFWMHNTPTPLDIGFFNRQGELLEKYAMLPFDETPVASHGDRLQLALEMNQGWFERNGIRPGAKLDMKALLAALREREFEPRKFGLGD